QKLSDAYDAANTLPEFVKTSDNADRIIGMSFEGSQTTEDRKVVFRFRKMGERVRALYSLNIALETRNWGQIWDQNKQMLSRKRPGNEDSMPLPWDAKLDRLRQGVLLNALVQCDETKPLMIKVKPDERVDQVLLRHANEAAAAKDYPRTLMTLRTYALIVYGVDEVPPPRPLLPPVNTGFRNPRPTPTRNSPLPANLRDDLDGLAALIQGMNAEAAGDLETAVGSYRQALAQTGPHVPIKTASERLAAIATARPDLMATAGPATVPPAPTPATPQPRTGLRQPTTRRAVGNPNP
ncbi:MAG: hypothetical protein JWM57_4006, partial [Phycisphaerales bacterium]|nr:hypothetical protein [Phycisphaerales bacterium]